MVAAHDSRYQVIQRELRELIRSGAFSPGQKFLTERDVAARFAISRPTANKILTRLVSEGVLHFRRGVGTFVNAGVLDYDLRQLVSFTDKARAAGFKPATRVVKFKRFKATAVNAAIAQRLALRAEETVFYFERLRLADGCPVILERRHVRAQFCPNLTERDLSGSLYSIWTKRFGLKIGGAEQTIHAVNLGAADARLLRVTPRTAALKVHATGLLASGDALWHEQTTYRSDAYAFHTVLGGINASRPAIGRLSEFIDIRAKPSRRRS